MSPLRCLLQAAVVALALPSVAVAQSSAQVTPAAAPELSPEIEARAVVLDTANLAVASAYEIIVDLPSARHASRYQQGEVNGFRYVLFPNGSGKVMRAANSRVVLFRLSCTVGVSCIITGSDSTGTTVAAINAPKPTMPVAPDGAALARYLAQWVLAGTGTAPVELAVVEPLAEPIPTVTEATPAVVPEQSATPVENVEAVASAPVQVEPVKSTPVQAEPIVSAPVQKVAKAPAPKPKQRAPTRSNTKSKAVRMPVAAKPVVRAPVPVTPVTRLSSPQQETFFQRINLACSITGSVTLRYKNHSSGSKRFGKPRASLGCSAKLSEKLSLRLSVIGYADKNEKSPSDAEFTYALTYRATDKITLSYSNYSARFDNSGSVFLDSLKSGTVRASYKLPSISMPNDKKLRCSASIGLPNPRDTTANLSCGYSVTDRFRVSATAYAYFPDQQESSDADFAYSASYRINDDWSVTYSNYANNRFFWNKSSSPGEGLLGGTVSVTYRFKF